MGIKEEKRKIAMLLHCAGDAVQDICSSLPGTSNINGFQEATGKLSEYFAPRQNTAYEIFRFRQERQQKGEKVDAYHMRLRHLATGCAFHDTDAKIQAQIIQTCQSSALRRKALAETILSLENLLKLARVMQLSDSQANVIEGQITAKPTTEINEHSNHEKLNSLRSKFKGKVKYNQTNGKRDMFPDKKYSLQKQVTGKCLNCGFEYPHKEENCCAQQNHPYAILVVNRDISVIVVCLRNINNYRPRGNPNNNYHSAPSQNMYHQGSGKHLPGKGKIQLLGTSLENPRTPDTTEGTIYSLHSSKITNHPTIHVKMSGMPVL